MKLMEIDKARYRKHLNVVFAGIVVALVVISLLSSTFLIHYFSTPEASHFIHNLAGVFIGGMLVVLVLMRLRHHPFLTEVVYIWDLKQMLNRIYRKQRRLEAAVAENDPDAMMIMHFQYSGSMQLYRLDDNTITIDDLQLKIGALAARMQQAGLDRSTDHFRPDMLDRF